MLPLILETYEGGVKSLPASNKLADVLPVPRAYPDELVLRRIASQNESRRNGYGKYNPQTVHFVHPTLRFVGVNYQQAVTPVVGL